MSGKPVGESATQIAHLMTVSDANTAGNVHGATIMKLADEAVEPAPAERSEIMATRAREQDGRT